MQKQRQIVIQYSDVAESYHEPVPKYSVFMEKNLSTILILVTIAFAAFAVIGTVVYQNDYESGYPLPGVVSYYIVYGNLLFLALWIVKRNDYDASEEIKKHFKSLFKATIFFIICNILRGTQFDYVVSSFFETSSFSFFFMIQIIMFAFFTFVIFYLFIRLMKNEYSE